VTRYRQFFLTGVFSLAAAAPAAAQTITAVHRVASKAPVKALTERESNPKGPFATLSLTQRDSIIGNIHELLGTKYKWAGITPEKGLDCSGFVKYVFAKLGINLPHKASELAKLGGQIQRDTSEMRPGDLMVFGKGKRISHVGIYVGNGIMIHASSANHKIVETAVAKYHPAKGLQWKGVRRVFSVDSTGTEFQNQP
jgi:cell wall-associated NlpC family hydrolase